jgi:hypothetical protein
MRYILINGIIATVGLLFWQCSATQQPMEVKVNSGNLLTNDRRKPTVQVYASETNPNRKTILKRYISKNPELRESYIIKETDSHWEIEIMTSATKEHSGYRVMYRVHKDSGESELLRHDTPQRLADDSLLIELETQPIEIKKKTDQN